MELFSGHEHESPDAVGVFRDIDKIFPIAVCRDVSVVASDSRRCLSNQKKNRYCAGICVPDVRYAVGLDVDGLRSAV